MSDCIISPGTQAVFIYRLYQFSGSLLIPIPLIALSLFLFAIVVVSTVRVIEPVLFEPHSEQLEWLLGTTFVGSAVQDIMIASALCYYLKRQRGNATLRRFVHKVGNPLYQTDGLTQYEFFD